MPNKLYIIGEFAAINKITTRMLRHYDKIGLMKPASMFENGYRAYSSEQITTVGLIKKYRDSGFSLNEITSLLVSDDESISRIAKLKLQELHKQDSISKATLEQCSLLAGSEHCIAFENKYDISYSLQRDSILLVSTASCTEEEIEDAFDRLYHSLEVLSILPSGLCILLSDMNAEKPFHVAVPVANFQVPNGFDCRIIKSGWQLSTLHYGDYYSIGSAYDKLLLYAQEQKLKLESQFTERYFLDSTHTPCPSEYITEISVKITP